uniref:Hexosyltransferase n=1 Tax=Meloidogyne javanica TaxID=6303 RepID=A0A915LEY3_MELJA
LDAFDNLTDIEKRAFDKGFNELFVVFKFHANVIEAFKEIISGVTWHEGEEHVDFSNKKDKLKLLLERCITKVLVADVSAINIIWMDFSDGVAEHMGLLVNRFKAGRGLLAGANIEISHSKGIFKALTPEKTDLKQKEEKLEIDQKDYETIDIDTEPITENFGVIAYEEFPFPTDNLFISFKNLKINYTIILPTPNGICPQKTKMFVFVPSRADGFYTRHMIRSSWGANLAERSIVLKFIVGWPQEQKVFELMQEELIKYDDLVVYDIDDSYRNLYLKVCFFMIF